MQRTITHFNRTKKLISRIKAIGNRGGFTMSSFIAYIPDDYSGDMQAIRQATDEDVRRYMDDQAFPGLRASIMSQFPYLWPRTWEFSREEGSSWIFPFLKEKYFRDLGFDPQASVFLKRDGRSMWFKCDYTYYAGADFLGLSRTQFANICQGYSSRVRKWKRAPGTCRLPKKIVLKKDMVDGKPEPEEPSGEFASVMAHPWEITAEDVATHLELLNNTSEVGKVMKPRYQDVFPISEY